MTPEGRVKREVKRLLEQYNIVAAGTREEILGADPTNGWYYMPVKGVAMGVNGIHDFVGHAKGLFFSVETKAGSGEMTPNQIHRRNGIVRGGGRFFEINEFTGMQAFEAWLKETIHG